ncbi:MAG TPA: tetratricopeptide repeat protein [Candidatus Tectomicrobia bacterium]|nr:tetratricopeptide repeat protein [Candidatus Tectomicrobia bacterium]
MADEGDGASRLEQFRQIVDMDPDDYFSRFGYASALFDAGRYPEAIREFRAAIRLKPDYSAAFRDLGKALERTGAHAEAMQVYHEGIPIAERNGDLQTVKEMQVFLTRLEQRQGRQPS